MVKKLLSTLLFLSICVTPLSANSTQESEEILELKKSDDSSDEKEPYFKVKPIITLFEQFQQGLGSESDVTSFEHQRGYIGLNIKAKTGWYVSGTFDIISKYHNEQDRLVFNSYLKNLEAGWSFKNLTIVGGIVKTKNFELKESAWGHRYVASSFEDRYGFAPSADLGLIAEYKIGEILSLDASLTNGKGYRTIELTGNYRYGFGATLKLIDNLIIRGFFDHYSSQYEGTPNQINTSLFAGYTLDKLVLGAEYNYMVNKSFVEDANAHGVSIYSTYNIFDWLNVFARYDHRGTTDDSVFSKGNALIFGAEWKPIKYIMFSPNFLVERVGDNSYTSYFNMNLSVKF